jgi:cytochrome o ubiquinol oxidase subunit 2
MPGMQSHLNLLAAQVGEFPGQAAHFSGDGFSRMHFLVHALSPEDFARWRTQAQAAAATLDAATYAALARPGVLDHPRTLRAVDAALFDKITRGTELAATASAATRGQP